MMTFKTISEAEQAANDFFIEEFGHDQGVGIDSRIGKIVVFYSKEDPGMDDTFTCIVEE